MEQGEIDRPEVTLRTFGLTVYLPGLLFFMGDGAVIPIVTLAARDLGASPAVAGVIFALRGVGVLAFDLPAGWLVSRIGERRALLLGSFLFVGSLCVWLVTSSLVVFAVFAFVSGCGWSVWQLARMAYMSEAVPMRIRGRAMSMLGGVNRIGFFVGPFAGAGLATIGGFDAVFGFCIGLVTAAAVLLTIVVPEGEGLDPGQRVRLKEVVREHSSVLLTAGVGAMLLSGLRAARFAILPLWADHIGLSAQGSSIVVGISLGLEVLLFYPGGSIMDRAGRKAVAIPCLLTMGSGLMLLPLAHSFETLLLIALFLGLGNGLASGIVMTLGADHAPPGARAQFLGAWRLVSDLGQAGGPLGVAGATAVVAIGGACVFTGGIGLLGAVFVLLLVPETLRR